jgi:hypothetical protein
MERNTILNNLGTTLIKIAALAGGAVTGAIIARWVDETRSTRAKERSRYDRTRYEQGLTPRSPSPQTDE